MRFKYILILLLALVSTNIIANECTAEQEPPEDPQDFNINEHLNKFKAIHNAVSQLPRSISPFSRDAVAASIMYHNFASGKPYDLKNNDNYNIGEEFGNWFFGAAAAQMGYPVEIATRAGAVVQQFQDYDSSSGLYMPEINLLVGVLMGATFNNNDNPGDKEQIIRGHNYSTEVFNLDPNASSSSNSCEPDSNNSENDSLGNGGSDGSGGLNYSGGWSTSGFVGGVGFWCAGCSVTITDLPDKP